MADAPAPTEGTETTTTEMAVDGECLLLSLSLPLSLPRRVCDPPHEFTLFLVLDMHCSYIFVSCSISQPGVCLWFMGL